MLPTHVSQCFVLGGHLPNPSHQASSPYLNGLNMVFLLGV